MFRYYFNVNKYNPSKKTADIEAIYVTDYYGLTQIDALKAFFVDGSNVTGPMGKELIPFEKEDDAGEFMADHAGKKLLKFDQVNAEVVKNLE